MTFTKRDYEIHKCNSPIAAKIKQKNFIEFCSGCKHVFNSWPLAEKSEGKPVTERLFDRMYYAKLPDGRMVCRKEPYKMFGINH